MSENTLLKLAASTPYENLSLTVTQEDDMQINLVSKSVSTDSPQRSTRKVKIKLTAIDALKLSEKLKDAAANLLNSSDNKEIDALNNHVKSLRREMTELEVVSDLAKVLINR
ncbi:hypothetical protein VCHA53O466_50099 [Vibrio chagasii]|nr:hypothetical protein VCHA53O466_50099 [Vibrio chagasii]